MMKYEIIMEYLKGLSFKSELSPGIFFTEEDPRTNLHIGVTTHISATDNGIYDVTLGFVLSPRKTDNVEVFHLEISYSALVILSPTGYENEEAIRRTLMIDVPATLLPVVRHLVNQWISEAGFPPVDLQRVDFKELYESRQDNMEGNSDEGAEKKAISPKRQAIPSLSYESVVGRMLRKEEALEFIDTCRKAGMDPTLKFEETPMYRFLMRFIEVPAFKMPLAWEKHFDETFFSSLFRMLMLDDEAECRFVKEEGLEIYVSYKDIHELSISRMTSDELDSLMESMIIDSWVNYNVTLGNIFEENLREEADHYLERFGNRCMIPFREYARFFGLFANQKLLNPDKVKEWYDRLQKIDITTIPYRF